MCGQLLPAQAQQLQGLTRTPEALSFVVAANMPISDRHRHNLLQVGSTVYRLQKQIHLLECIDHLLCSTCRVRLCSTCRVRLFSTCLPCISLDVLGRRNPHRSNLNQSENR
ncbi:unnamed protein product, partial [Closterium sp. NIES-64]